MASIRVAKNSHIVLVGLQYNPNALRVKNIRKKQMKRIGNLWEKIIDIDNIKLAHQRARKDKTFYREVKMVDSDIDYYAGLIHDMLANKTYEVSEYRR